MNEPLLTIDDATREFRVSAKTIRRRLASGAIDGAFKRPGARGEEWVIPRSALVAAGFARRPDVDATEIPEDPDEERAYWRERALAAETALRGRSAPDSPGRQGVVVGGVGWFFIVLAVVLAALATLLAVSDDDADPDPAPVDAVTAALAELTDPGDALGIVGTASARLLPDRRVPVPIERGELDDTTPRYVVAAAESAEPGAMALIDELAGGSRTVLAVERPTGMVRIFDRSGAPGPTDDAVDPPDAPPPPPPVGEEPGGEEAGDVGPPAPPQVDSAPDGSPPATPPPPAPSDTVVVQPGESFWSIAVDRVTADGAAEADLGTVTSYWQQLVDANTDVLVEPGNPDLLHVGQHLELPPAPA